MATKTQDHEHSYYLRDSPVEGRHQELVGSQAAVEGNQAAEEGSQVAEAGSLPHMVGNSCLIS